MLHIPPTNYHLLAAKQEPNQKAYLFKKHIDNFLGQKSQENRPVGTKMDKTERAVRVGRRKRDSKVESNDCPEIPDRAETSDIPSFPLGNEQTAFLTTSPTIVKLII